jgi:AMMECR1 domain-containing protein
VAFTREPRPAPAPLTLAGKEQRQLLAAARQALAETAAGRKASAPLSADPRFNLPAAVTLTLRGKDGKAAGSAGTSQAEESLLEAVVTAAGKLSKEAASAGPGAKLELTVAGQTFGE